MAIVSKAQFARQQGLSRARVTQLCKQGLPQRPDGKIDRVAAERWLRENILPPPGHSDGAGFLKARTAVEVLKAQERRIRLQRMQGVIMTVSSAEQILFDCARESRDAWLAWPARVAVSMAAELGIDARLLADVLLRYVKAELTEQGEPDADFAALTEAEK